MATASSLERFLFGGGLGKAAEDDSSYINRKAVKYGLQGATYLHLGRRWAICQLIGVPAIVLVVLPGRAARVTEVVLMAICFLFAIGRATSASGVKPKGS